MTTKPRRCKNFFKMSSARDALANASVHFGRVIRGEPLWQKQDLPLSTVPDTKFSDGQFSATKKDTSLSPAND